MSQSSYGICTIIAKNYVSFARTLFHSFQSHNPGVRCFCLVVDEWQGFLDPKEEPFEILSAGELGMPDLGSLTFKYDITELSTAAKPFLLERLLAEYGIERLLYLDPDILVTGTLGGLYERLGSVDFLVTPHLDKDFPDDGKMPDDRVIMQSGIYNLGFFGLRRSDNSLALLKWWQHKLKDKCVMEHTAGYFVDQRFIDLAVGLFPDFEIIRDPGCNAAYWNLHSRTISQAEGGWQSNGVPLSFFHFSGYSPKRPGVISKHTNRFVLETRPDVQPLFDIYRALLIANGYETTCSWPYTYGAYSTGIPVDYGHRQFYRNLPAAGRQISKPFNSPAELKRAMREEEERRHPFSVLRATRNYLGTIRRGLLRRWRL